MKKQSKLVTTLKKVFSIGQVEPLEENIIEDSYRSVSEKELKSILKEIYVPNTRSQAIVDKLQIPSMLEPLSRELIERKMDHEKLGAIAPEIEQAASILIPSILTPIDFRKNTFNLVVEGKESDSVKTEVIKHLTDHFDKELEFSVKLSEWVNEAMFKSGAKAIMILPTNTIGRLRDGIVSVESMHTEINSFIRDIEGSLEHISSAQIQPKFYENEEVIDKTIGTGIFESILNDTSRTYEQRALDQKKIRTQIKSGMTKALDYFGQKKLVSFSDDPRMLIKHKIISQGSIESLNSDILKKLGQDTKPVLRKDRNDGVAQSNINTNSAMYNYLPYIDLNEYVKGNDISDYPALIELPTESVIPIIIEGAPDNHIGYFIVINENGSPVSINSDNFNDILTTNSGSQRINNLYDAFYGSTQFSLQKRMSNDAKLEILNTIYDGFIRSMLEKKLDMLGIMQSHIDISNNMSRVMFARLLKNAETRVVFVPRKLITYMAFQYHSDGTGKSRIDKIKFPLSLKMTLIVVRLISLIESAINRRTINITLDDNIGNPLELLRSVKKEIVSNKTYGLSYDPSTIIKSVLDKEITIIPNKIPGVDEFSISDTPNNVDYPRPDDGILDEINNMYMMNLGVPPSAMNRLSEDEFSRSVASNNIFFSNQLKTYQKEVCSSISELMITYITFSKKLKEELLAILQKDAPQEATEGIKDNEKVEADTDDLKDKAADTKENINQRLEQLIRNVKLTLPSPNLANDKSSFDELNDYIGIVDNVVNTLFPDELVLDAEIANVIKVLRAQTKKTILQTYIKDNSLLADLDFDALKDLDITGAVGTTQKLMNFKKALEGVVTAFTASETEDTGTNPW